MTSKINTLSLLSLSTLRFVFSRQTNFEPQLDSKMFSIFFFEESRKVQKNRHRFNILRSVIVLIAISAITYTLVGYDQKGVMGVVLCLCGVGYLMLRGAYPKETREKISRSELREVFLKKIREEKILNRIQDEEIISALLKKIETVLHLRKKRTQRKQLFNIFKLLEEISLENNVFFEKTTEALKVYQLNNTHIANFLVKIDLKRKERMWEEKDKKKEAAKQLSFAEN